MPRAVGHADLTRGAFPAINGQPVVKVAETTLAAGESLVRDWQELQPTVRSLIKMVQAAVEGETLEMAEAAKLLHLSASVVQKLGSAAQGMLRASEGLAKLEMLLSVGRGERKKPAEMTEKQLAGVLIESLRKIAADGPCPVCTKDVEEVA